MATLVSPVAESTDASVPTHLGTAGCARSCAPTADSDEDFAWKDADGWNLWTDDPTEPQAAPVTVAGVGT